MWFFKKKEPQPEPEPEPERFVTVFAADPGQYDTESTPAFTIPASHLSRPRLAVLAAREVADECYSYDLRQHGMVVVACTNQELVDAVVKTAEEEAAAGRCADGAVGRLPPSPCRNARVRWTREGGSRATGRDKMRIFKKKKKAEPERFVTVYAADPSRYHEKAPGFTIPASHLTRPCLAPLVAKEVDDNYLSYELQQLARKDGVVVVACKNSELVDALVQTMAEEAAAGRCAEGAVV